MKLVLFNFITSEPNRIDGISQYAFSLLRRLVERGVNEYVLLTSWREDALPSEIRALDIRTIHVDPIYREKLAYLINAVRSWRVAKELSADIVFTPHPFGALFGGRKRVMVMHDLYRLIWPQLYRKDRVWTWRSFVRWSSWRSHAVICVSDATRRDFIAKFGAGTETHVIHEASTLGAASHADGSADSQSPFGLTVANITPTKNIGLLFEALSILQQKGVEPTFYWVGRDDSGDFAAAQERFPNVRNIKSLGSVPAERLAKLYRDAAFYVTTSFIEGFCIPVLEAQQVGTPVLCSDIPTLREVAGIGALYFPADEPEKLADHIEAMWSDPAARQALSALALTNADRFSWAKAAAETEAVFDHLVRTH